MADRRKDELVRFLEARALKPVLNAKAAGRSEAEQKSSNKYRKPPGQRSSEGQRLTAHSRQFNEGGSHVDCAQHRSHRAVARGF